MDKKNIKNLGDSRREIRVVFSLIFFFFFFRSRRKWTGRFFLLFFLFFSFSLLNKRALVVSKIVK